MRPHTPTTLNISQASGVTSPPQTPRTASPTINRIPAFKPHSSPNYRSMGQETGRSNIRSLGGKSASGFTRGLRPEEISPRSSDSSSDTESEASDDSESSSQSPMAAYPMFSHHHVVQHASIRITVEESTFIVEEMSDKDSMDASDDEDILRPYDFEDAESERSRSRPRALDLPSDLLDNFHKINCFEDNSEEEFSGGEEEFERARQQRRQQRRLRRMTSGSLSKRTVSERGSDPDDEDLQPWINADDAASTSSNTMPRRTRRKTDRFSASFFHMGMGFTERIEELKEPNSEDEIILDEGEILAELPYYSMEVDSDGDGFD